jgi:hypothetical protein
MLERDEASQRQALPKKAGIVGQNRQKPNPPLGAASLKEWANPRRPHHAGLGGVLLYAMLLQVMPNQGVNSFQCPSETTSTIPSTTLMAVSSSIAYPGTRMPAAHLSASAMVFSGSIS